MNVPGIPTEFLRIAGAQPRGFPGGIATDAGRRGTASARAGRTGERVAYLDVARGIGILLVVLGHCIGGVHAAGLVSDGSPAWFSFYLIYSFHMPLFFFLAGVFVEARIVSRPGHFAATAVMRIAYPYFLWGAVQTAFSILAAGVVNNPVALPPAYQFVSMFWAPPAQFWFLYVLFFLHLVALIAIRAAGRVGFALAFALIFAACAVWPGVAGFVTHYVSGADILFYVLAVIVGGWLVNWRGRIASPYALALIGAIVFLSLVWIGWRAQASPDSYATLPAAFAGTAVVVLLCRSDALRENRWLAYLGRRSLTIYVLHVLCVAGTRIALLKGLHAANLAVVFPAIFVAGVAGPLIAYRIAQALRLNAALGLS